MRLEFLAQGVRANLQASIQEAILQTMLDAGVSEEEAKQQTSQLLQYLQQLGTTELLTNYGKNSFQIRFIWNWSSK